MSTSKECVKWTPLLMAATMFTAVCSPAFAAETVVEAIEEGDLIFNARLRYEHVSQDGFAEDADALTLRTRLGFETGEIWNTKFLIEFEHVTDVGVDDYNSTTNGQGMFPVIADPDTTELNRAQFTYTGIEDTSVTVGRQRVILNNARFIGNVGFRQNEQTFDAIKVTNASLGPVALTYLYIDKVHRIFGDDHPLGEFDSNSHVVQADVPTPIGNLSGYALLLDFDNAAAMSRATYGARLSGSTTISDGVDLTYVAEFATQSDYGDNTGSFDLSYLHGQAMVASGPLSGGVGFEVLEGDGSVGFATPLATLHAFQGWADVFLTTPANGVRDVYGRIGYAFDVGGRRLSTNLVYHDFTSDNGDINYGSEFDAVASLALTDHVALQLKAARFNGANGGPADRDKVWLAITVSY